MTCWRFGLRRRMLPYLEGRLTESETARLERHLLDCGACRDLLVRLRLAHQMAQRLAFVRPDTCELPAFIDVGIPQPQAQPLLSTPGVSGWRDWMERFATPRVVTALSALALLQLGLLLVSNRGVLFGEHRQTPVNTAAVDLSEFREISIRDLRANTQPHVATEGYVEGVHTDREEGTVAFKLVEDRGAAGAFVVCEIMGPIPMSPPKVGSHVRVYGVARYDAQQDRRWNEINPVLNIAPLP